MPLSPGLLRIWQRATNHCLRLWWEVPVMLPMLEGWPIDAGADPGCSCCWRLFPSVVVVVVGGRSSARAGVQMERLVDGIRSFPGLYCLRLAVCVLLFRPSYYGLCRCPALSVVVGAVLQRPHWMAVIAWFLCPGVAFGKPS